MERLTAPNQLLQARSYRWVRSSKGMIAGVCEGLGRSFGIEPWLMRLVWIVAVLAFGTGLLFYAILALCLPREDKQAEAKSRRLLGVCARLSQISGIEVGVVRTIAVLLALASFGAVAIGYILLYFVVPDEKNALSTY